MHDSSVIRPDDNPGDFALSFFPNRYVPVHQDPFFKLKICELSLLGFDRDSSMTFAYIRCIYTYTENIDTLIRPLGIFNLFLFPQKGCDLLAKSEKHAIVSKLWSLNVPCELPNHFDRFRDLFDDLHIQAKI